MPAALKRRLNSKQLSGAQATKLAVRWRIRVGLLELNGVSDDFLPYKQAHCCYIVPFANNAIYSDNFRALLELKDDPF